MAEDKPQWEKPVALQLDALARGSGVCDAGASDVVDCTDGGLAVNACNAGEQFA